ncbi:MAG: TIGR02099 family protein [Leptothrix sp. (in: Bacteria)]|nr:TIGR02099 family protein [Leptothrix sp. (in: b-proteobacteria)]
MYPLPSPYPSPPPVADPRRRPRLRRVLRWASMLVVALFGLGVVAWMILQWGLLPRLNEWRPQVEARASAALGAPVRIGKLRVLSAGWLPSFEIHDLRVLDSQGRDALHLARVVAALSPKSLLLLEPRLAQLLIEDASLDLRRDREGRFFVAGLALRAGDAAADTAAESAALDGLFELPELVLRRGTLRWTDELLGAPPLALSAVELVLRNGLRRHELRVDATPPPPWGERFTLQGDFTQPLLAPASQWRRWSGEARLSLPRADVAAWRQHVTLPFELSQGRGTLRAWVTIADGRPVLTGAEVALTEVAMRLAPSLPPLELKRLEGRVEARLDDRSLAFEAERLSFETDDGVTWAPSALQLRLSRAAAGAAFDGGSVRADRLDLATMALLAHRLPLGSGLRRGLAALAPRGSVSGLVGRWTGPIDAPQRFEIKAKGQALALAAGAAGAADADGRRSAGRPGFSGADLEFSASESGGQARLAMHGGTLTFPGVFDAPVLALQRLAGRITWRRGADAAVPGQWEVAVQDLVFANDDLAGTLNGRWRSGAAEGVGLGRRYPGSLELSGRIQRAQAARVAPYLPTGLPRAARDYVARAVTAGRITGGSFEVQGDLWRFPYAQPGPGVFRIKLRTEDVALAYVPGTPDRPSPWPAVAGLSGELEFDRAAMRVSEASATLQGLTLRQVRGGIQDMANEGVLRLDGQVRGALADMLRFVDATPVGGWLGGALHEATGSGQAELTLALQIPIGAAGRSTVRGALQLAGNDVRLLPGTPLLADTRGRISFTQRGLTMAGVRARTLGGETSFDGGTQADGSLRFSGQGVASADGLLKAGELPLLAPLRGSLRGQAAYRVQLGFVGGRTELLVSSSLEGLGADLPAPLAKPAAAAWPLRVQMAPRAGGGELLSVSLGELLQARYELADKIGAAGGAAGGAQGVVVVRGSVGVGTAAPAMPSAGVLAALRLPRLDLDAWRQRLGMGEGGAGGVAGGDAGVDAGAAMPTQLTLNVDALTLFQRRFSGVAMTLQQQRTVADTGWQAQVRADQLEGTITLRSPRDAGGPGRISARLARLVVPGATAAADRDLLPQAPEAGPVSVPALDIVIDALQWGERALGAVELSAFNRASASRPGTSEWRLDRLRVSAADATLQAQGVWSAGRRLVLDFGLDLADSGRFAQRMGAGNALRGGKGRIEGQLSWAGSPLSPPLASLDGRMKIALEEGRFLNAEPGAARLLGVLSLQALPRRFLLDFRDVFQEGFAFDKVGGDVRVEQGVARTDNLRIVGVQAAVLVDGRADLQHETQDLRVVAMPEINTGAASLAIAAINPALALSSVLAQWLLREPMVAASTREFHITGSWTDPKVERVDRGAPAASSSAPSGR